MNLLFLIPLLGYGIFLGASQADASLLWLTLLSIAGIWLQGRRQVFDLSEQVRFVGNRVWLGERRLNLFPPLWGSDVRNKVFAAALWQDPLKNLDTIKTFSSSIGFTTSGKLVQQPISNRAPHAILIGPSGSGKTELMRLIAAQHESEIWAIDFNSGIGLKDIYSVRLSATAHNTQPLEIMHQEFLSRAQRAMNSKLLIVVDGVAEAMQNQGALTLLELVASRGRVLNVMMLLANQTMEGVPRSLWANCANRFSLGADLESRTQLGFSGKSECEFGDWGQADLLQGARLLSFRFPLGFRNEKAAPVIAEAVNPLLSRVSTRPQ